MTLYLAYASNLCPLQMAKRCPDSQHVGNIELNGWELFFFEDGYASIRQADEKTSAFCAVYKLTEACEKALDHHESISDNTYYRHTISLGGIDHLIYIATNTNSGTPYKDYKNRILSGMKVREAPSQYIDALISTPSKDVDSPKNDYSDEGGGFNRETT